MGVQVAHCFGPDQPYTQEQVAGQYAQFALRIAGAGGHGAAGDQSAAGGHGAAGGRSAAGGHRAAGDQGAAGTGR